jgi:hypothetical protein
MSAKVGPTCPHSLSEETSILFSKTADCACSYTVLSQSVNQPVLTSLYAVCSLTLLTRFSFLISYLLLIVTAGIQRLAHPSVRQVL